MANKKPLNPSLQTELKKTDFRVAIFGSARTKKNDIIYKKVFELAKEIGKYEFDMVTGGGPGIMEAANAGHEHGDKRHKADNIGLIIKLPWENEGNKHLEIKKEFNKFSGRLDAFMALSNVVVVMPGGVGTCLELFYTWQLIQVGHINPVPIILIGKMWEELMNWVKKYPIKMGLISPKEADCIFIAKNNKEAMKMIMQTHEEFKQGKHMNKKYLS